jgi:hypothetical protein
MLGLSQVNNYFMYSIFFAFFYLISLIPWPVVYVLSDGVAFLLRKILKYRLDIVQHNLAIAFPNKSIQERNQISKEFYQKFTDTFFKLFEEIGSGSDTQLMVTTACVAPKRLIIVPMIAKSANGVSGTAVFKPTISPFASEPATCSPYSISNLQVFVSGNPLYSTVLNYGYEHFLNEMNNFGLNSNLVTGLVSSRISLRHYLNNYGYIVCNLGRRLLGK